jgi:ATP-dependent protease HslVU (ClpYQ) ATPase subunit
VNKRPGRAAVGQAHDPGADLIGPGERVGREIDRTEEGPLDSRMAQPPFYLLVKGKRGRIVSEIGYVGRQVDHVPRELCDEVDHGEVDR